MKRTICSTGARSPEDKHLYFFVLLFLLVDSPFLSSALRFTPVLLSFPFASFPLVSFPFPFPTLLLSSLGSLG